MTVERREELTEVVSYNTANVGPVVMGNPTAVATYQTATVTSNPYATRGMQILKI